MTAKLSCSALNCVHNNGGLCIANTIHVSGEKAHSSLRTECDTFAEKGFKNAITHLPNMNLFGEIRQVFTNKTIQVSPYIGCDAVHCAYNVERICSAKNVQITGPDAHGSHDTMCETFII